MVLSCKSAVFLAICFLLGLISDRGIVDAGVPNPFRSFGSGNILGYDVPSRTSGELECLTENKHPGSCMSRKECQQLGGLISGSCGSYGVCCEISMACGKVSRAKKTVIRNPSPISEYCSYYFRPYSKYVCQLRIDFSAKIGAPTIPKRNQSNSYVRCEGSYLKINEYTICGVNKNQHLYVPFNAEAYGLGTEVGLIVVHKEAENAATDYWDIVVTQIECPPRLDNSTKKSQFWEWGSTGQTSGHRFDNELIAPPGCTQYFFEKTGVMESFNYNNGRGPYLGNYRYGICFRRTDWVKSILFEATTFRMDSNRSPDAIQTGRTCYDPTNPNSSRDYLLIPDAILTSSDGSRPIEASRFCGRTLEGKQLLYAPPGPFVITVNTDTKYNSRGPNYEAGWSIRYTIQ